MCDGLFGSVATPLIYTTTKKSLKKKKKKLFGLKERRQKSLRDRAGRVLSMRQKYPVGADALFFLYFRILLFVHAQPSRRAADLDISAPGLLL